MIYVYNYADYSDPSETHFDSQVFVSGCIGKVSRFVDGKNEYVMFGVKVLDEKTGNFDEKFKYIKIDTSYWSENHKEKFYNDLNNFSNDDRICIFNGNILNGLLLFDGKVYDDFGDDVEWKMTKFLENNTSINSKKIVNSFLFNNVERFSINKINDKSWNNIIEWGMTTVLDCTKTSGLDKIKKEIYKNPEINWNDRLLHIENKEKEIIKKKSVERER